MRKKSSVNLVFVGLSGYQYPHTRVRCYNFARGLNEFPGVVVAGPHGYFVAETRAEAMAYLDDLNSRARAIYHRRRRVREMVASRFGQDGLFESEVA